MIPKREASLKSAFSKIFRAELPEAVVLFYATAGAPDREIIYNGKASQWEFKHATPCISSTGIQELMCMRLEQQGHCRYVLWHESVAFGKFTAIIRPTEVHSWVQRQILVPRIEARCEGFNHHWLVEQIKRIHQ